MDRDKHIPEVLTILISYKGEIMKNEEGVFKNTQAL